MRIVAFHIAVAIGAMAIGLHANGVDGCDVGLVWSGHSVGFSLVRDGERQFVAYYDAERRMTIAQRDGEGCAWTYQILPETVGWDSHNSIAMAIDDAGQLHVAGNMHVHPLKYFRTRQPGDITTLERIPAMVGTEEAKVTYPVFLRGPAGEFLFTYRDGSSGNGAQLFNRYDAVTATWSRYLDSPLFDGEGLRNAYFHGPKPGPDGFYHLAWVWRESSDCSTNNTVSYARSRDLRHWETASGEAVTLPMRRETRLTVDPVPEQGGVMNTSIAIGFDDQGRAVVSYHKFDAAGITQAYNARWEDGAWHIHQASAWDYRWAPSGGGSIEVHVRVGPVRKEPDGSFTQTYNHHKMGSGRWILDPLSLTPVGTLPLLDEVPAELRRVESTFPGMGARFAFERDPRGEGVGDYFLRWETLGPNRDKPREGDLPGPSMLRVYRR